MEKVHPQSGEIGLTTNRDDACHKFVVDDLIHGDEKDVSFHDRRLHFEKPLLCYVRRESASGYRVH